MQVKDITKWHVLQQDGQNYKSDKAKCWSDMKQNSL